ncbi:hypothetical protein DFH07DRAFT_769322 [Mycena maculata]|uniref:Uncharacterized protein n=1 Tax=Mycena maculata TaxID=230809 RepID=A0AAD7JML6_9AGAR|nr:hypothetical protein DFH07DRAFT_769322 [Mycena maculata]
MLAGIKLDDDSNLNVHNFDTNGIGGGSRPQWVKLIHIGLGATIVGVVGVSVTCAVSVLAPVAAIRNFDAARCINQNISWPHFHRALAEHKSAEAFQAVLLVIGQSLPVKFVGGNDVTHIFKPVWDSSPKIIIISHARATQFNFKRPPWFEPEWIFSRPNFLVFPLPSGTSWSVILELLLYLPVHARHATLTLTSLVGICSL